MKMAGRSYRSSRKKPKVKKGINGILDFEFASRYAA